VDDWLLGGFMKRTISAVLVTLALAVAVLAQANWTFVCKALDSKDREYSTYLDLSSKHMEGTFTVITSYAVWATPVTSDGYSGIKMYKNVLQIDCARNVKKLTYIGYLDADGKVIVEESYPDAQDEAITLDHVDAKEKPFYCGQ
jgi:hypothetical protein